MRFSAYDVIHAKWGAIDPYTGDYAVKCGNYREFQADGLDTIYGTSTVDRVSWFQDRPGNNTLSFPRDYDATMTPSVPHEELPRFAMDKNLGNFLLRGSQFATDKRRYLGFPWYATGQVDSPVLYPGKNSEHTSHRQQKDYYRLGNPLTSTPFEAARLMARRDVETAINSNLGENEFRLVPWMMMSGTSGAASIDPDVFLDFRQFRELQQMVRAKNVGELLFWTNVTNTSDTDLAWAETAEWLPRVYATRVLTYVRQTGPITIPPPLVDVERLEFTLNEPGNPSNREYSVEVLSDPPPFGSSTRVSELVVDFEWTGTDGGPYVNENMVDVAIESTANHGDVTGEVYYWGPDNSNNLTWMPLRTFSCEDSDILDHYYAFHAPQSPGDGLYRSRERFVDRPIHIFYESLKYKSRLKLVHSRDGTFTSRYDLVQLMPVGSLCDDDHERGPSRPRSDADRNGIIEPADFDAFAERWFSESASADLNLNGELDEGDIQTFEDAYVTGT